MTADQIKDAARARLAEIAAERKALDVEERELRRMMGEGALPVLPAPIVPAPSLPPWEIIRSIPVWPEPPHYPDPLNPWRVTCAGGTNIQGPPPGLTGIRIDGPPLGGSTIAIPGGGLGWVETPVSIAIFQGTGPAVTVIDASPLATGPARVYNVNTCTTIWPNGQPAWPVTGPVFGSS